MSTITQVRDEAEQGPRSGHLGTSWEIAVVTVFIVVIIAIIGAVLFQLRRKRRMRRQQDEEAAAAVVATEQRERERESVRKNKDRRERPSSRVERSGSVSPIDKPRPTASPARHGKTSPHRHSKELEMDYYDHPSQKPPKWYWESSKR